MSPSRELQLSVTARSPLAEIFVIDDQFALVDRSIGDLDCRVSPGVYKVKAKLADATYERLILLDEDTSLDISSELVMGSAVPISTPFPTAPPPTAPAAAARPTGQAGPVSRSPEPARRPPGPAREQAVRSITGTGGGTAQVLLMTRADTRSSDAPTAPAAISLHRLDGTTIAELDPADRPDRSGQAQTVDVDPGAYLVRRRDRLGDQIEQSVYAVPGWQTQLFAIEAPGDDTEIGSSRVSVLMAQHPFSPTDPELPLVEAARTALADERKVASDALAELLLETDNPMLGLFGAHLMLISRDAELTRRENAGAGRLSERVVAAPVEFDQTRFELIVDRLATVFGSAHPDIVALSTQRSGQNVRALQPIGAPPMLWRSWVLLIAASNQAPELVPIGVWQQSMHVLPLRPFFLWSPAGHDTELARTWTRDIADNLSARTPERQAEIFRGDARTPQQSNAPAPVDEEARRRVSEELLMPRAAIDRLADGEHL